MSHKQKHVGPTSSRVSPPLGALPSQPDSPEVQLPPPEPEGPQPPGQAIAIIGHSDAVQKAPGDAMLDIVRFLPQSGSHGHLADESQKIFLVQSSPPCCRTPALKL